MARTYLIRGGASFLLGDGSVKTGGDTIELEDDVARIHADKIELPAQEAVVIEATLDETEHF